MSAAFIICACTVIVPLIVRMAASIQWKNFLIISNYSNLFG